MKMNLFNSNTSNFATADVINQLGRLNIKGSKHIVIVPDKYSLGVEKEIFERLELSGASNIDVVSFTRLAIKAQKGKQKPCLTKEGAVILLKKVINKVSPELKHYNFVAHKDGFPKEIFAVIASIRNCGYSAADLLEAMPKLPATTARKTADITLILTEYLAALEASYDDSTTRLDSFTRNINTCEWIAKSNIYIVGFPSFTGKQLQIITALTAVSQSVNIAINTTNNGANSAFYPSNTLQSLIDACAPLGITPNINSSFSVIKEPFNTINKELFAFSKITSTPHAERLTLYAEEHIYNEIAAVASEISRLVRRENYRFKDIAVVNCVPEINSIVSSIFARYNIAHFVDNSFPLAESLESSFLTSVIECAILNCKQSAFVSVMKKPHLKLDFDAVNDTENFILKYGFTFTALSSPFKIENSARYEQIRSTVASVVARFPQKASCKEYADIAKQLLSDFYTEDVAQLFGDLPQTTAISYNNQAHNKLMSLIDEAAFLLNDTYLTLSAFLDTISATIAVSKITLIPEYLDSVFIGSPKDSRFTDIKALFVMGCSSDTLPTIHKYKAIISATDNIVLEQAGVRLFPTPMDLILEDQYYFLELLTAPSEKLYMGYSHTSHDGSPLRPSSVLKEISALTGVKIAPLSNNFNSLNAVTSEELEDCAVTTKNAYFEYLYNRNKNIQYDKNGILNLQSLYIALDDTQKANIARNDNTETPIYSPIPELYFSPNADGSKNTRITALEMYYRCPYAHHLQVGLKLNERETVSLQSMDIGNILHGIMELFFARTLGALDSTPQAELEAIMDTAITDACAKFVPTNQLNILNTNMLKNIKREGKNALIILTENIKKGNYRPVHIEMSFGTKETDHKPIKFEVGGTEFLMRGKIDRVDKCGERIAVIDYKTGSVHSELSHLYMGNKLQLYTYLNVLIEEGNKVGGVFYLPIKDRYTTKKQSYKLDGQMMFSDENLHDFSRDFRQYAKDLGARTVECDIITAAISNTKKHGDKLKFNKNSATEEQFIDYANYAYIMSQNAIADIVSGSIVKSPVEDTCKYCSYRAICGDSGLNNERLKASDSMRPRAESPTETYDDEE